YSITSGMGITLSSLQAINLSSAVTTAQTINLVNLATGSLLYTGPLTITNSSTAAGNTLVIGPSTVIGTAASNTNGVLFGGTGNSQFTGSFASGPGLVTGGVIKDGPGTLTLSGSGANLTGTLSLSGGTMVLDYSTNAAVKIGSTASLGLLGGILS